MQTKRDEQGGGFPSIYATSNPPRQSLPMLV